MSGILPILLLLAAGAGDARMAPNAESTGSCSNFVTSVPVVISTPGTWCLTQDLTSTSINTAIYINVDNVTLDCNGHRVERAGSNIDAYGLTSFNVTDVTIRNCHVVGFRVGIAMQQASQPPSLRHLVEDNRVEDSVEAGIIVSGPGSVIRRNKVLETVSRNGAIAVSGIVAGNDVDIVDNLVSGVEGLDAPVTGISFSGTGSVRGNRVRDIRRSGGTGALIGIRISGSTSRATVRGNTLMDNGQAGSVGVSCTASTVRVKNNSIKGFATPLSTCPNDGNVIKP